MIEVFLRFKRRIFNIKVVKPIVMATFFSNVVTIFCIQCVTTSVKEHKLIIENLPYKKQCYSSMKVLEGAKCNLS